MDGSAKARIEDPRRGAVILAIVLVLGGAGCRPEVQRTSSPTGAPASPSRDPDAGVVTVPDGWFIERDPLPPLVEPRIVVAAGSYDFPRPPLMACGTQPGLEALPPDDVFFWIVRYPPVGTGNPIVLANRPAWPAHFRLDLPHRHGDVECAAGTADVRDYRLRAGDHLVQVLVGIGGGADERLKRQLENVVSSYDP